MRRLLPLVLCVLLFASSCAAEPKVKRVEIPMTDGTALVADVYTPAKGEGPWPMVLMRSTYGRELGKGIAAEFAKRGMGLVVQDTRGRGESPGERNVFYTDGWRAGLTDGADTLRWIAEQPWSNGRIGTYGGSALALTQSLLAPVAPPELKCQFLDAGTGAWYPFLYTGGVWQKNLAEGWLTGIQEPHVIDLWKAHPTDDEFWSYMDSDARAADIDAPAVFVGGWYDIFTQGTIDAFLAREKRGGDSARGRNHLIMRWSGHGADKGDTQFTSDFKLPKSRFDFPVGQIAEAWFAKHLLGREDAMDAYSTVHYFTLGDDTDPDAPGMEWRTAESWPPLPTQETAFYLQAEGGALSMEPATGTAALSYTFDPTDPYPTHGGNNLLLPFGPFDQRKFTTTREDQLLFLSPPLEAPMEITGRIAVKLFVSTDAPDTDFTAKLLDVYPAPDGRQINMVEGIQRVKYRNGYKEPAPLLTGPEEVVEVTIDCWSTSWVVNTGHRIGLVISSSNYPHFDVNPNTGADFSGGEMRPAKNVVHLGPDTPSAVLLPVVTKE